MTKPIPPSEFALPPAPMRSRAMAGLAGAIDAVAESAAPSHGFLRFQWFAAALGAYGGSARTLLVERGETPVAALPLMGFGPALLGLAQVPGCYWPFRSFPVAADARDEELAALLGLLGRTVNALRIGPVYDNDASLQRLLPIARARGWAVLDRFVAESFVLDMAALRDEGTWPRNSTLRKNRFHEKHLAEHGALDWSFVSGDGWSDAAFNALAAVERTSWVAAETDGSDAKFTESGHGAFWRAAASDPILAGMFWSALLRVEGKPAAFSFDLNAGTLKYAIANSYDPGFAKHSPGKLLYYRNLERGLADGIDTVDWGAGDSGYKRTIGASAGPAIRDWLLVRPGLSALAGRMLANRWRASGRGR